ncbi:unnamed protein product, partial [Ectocarpus fasciculatus]
KRPSSLRRRTSSLCWPKRNESSARCLATTRRTRPLGLRATASSCAWMGPAW